MSRRNTAAEEVEDLRRAMTSIGRVIGGAATPKGKLQQITGILFLCNVTVQPVATQPGDTK